MPFNRFTLATSAIFSLVVLSACQQTPPLPSEYDGTRAAYSEWSCNGEPMLAQFYGARVVISDSSSSRWLDRGTQVGQVFRNDTHSVRFRDDTAIWTQHGESVTCTQRALPEHWQEAQQAGRGKLHFMAEGPQQQWQFKLLDKQAIIEAAEEDGHRVDRTLPAGEGTYYLDMWTFNIQTPQDRMRVQVVDGLCRNRRDQIPYPSSVQINWNDQVLQGCGRWLAKSGYRP